MKRIVILVGGCLLLLLSGVCLPALYAEGVDSLILYRQQYTQAGTPQAQAKALQSIVLYLSNAHKAPDTALHYLGLLEEKIKRLPEEKRKGYAISIVKTRSTVAYLKKDYPESYRQALALLALARENKSREALLDGNFMAFIVLSSLGDNTNAEKYADVFGQLNLDEHKGDTLKLYSDYWSLALMYKLIEKPEKSEQYLKALIQMEQRRNDSARIMDVYANWCNLYADSLHIAKAQTLLDTAVAYAADDPLRNRSLLEYKIGVWQVQKRSADIVQLLLDNGFGTADKNTISINTIMGLAYLDMAKRSSPADAGLLRKARYYLVRASAQDFDLGMILSENTMNKPSIWFALAEAQERLGDYRDALESYKHYYISKDSIYGAAHKNEVLRSELEYEAGRFRDSVSSREKEMRLQQQLSTKQSENVRNLAVTASAAMALLLGITGFAFLRKRKDNRIIAEEKEKSDSLLLNILPAEVAEELKEHGNTEAKVYEDVTVLFTDFVNFTQISEQLGPQKLVAELHSCFKGFDAIMEKNGLEKIKTIGDAYLAVSGLPAGSPEHAARAVAAALEITRFMQERKSDIAFEVRVGLHSGPLVAGIVGVKKFAYDIWGDTVNIASRMESASIPGKVNISEHTYQLVKDKYDCTYRGKINAKNKGEMDMYFVNGPVSATKY